ncbi:MgtC/SapB family protein [Sphingomonas limnosediminicola]|uniref:MgtC/SapB family protein n=1 Tax=Sphingomonas limnosediminicola TaxID=940133 RepID=A0ABP7LC04_9SPHN
MALAVLAALACGLLIGIERGWKLKDQRPGTRVAGVRTFSMLGLGTGIAGLIGARGHPIVAGAIVVGAVAIMVIAYSRELRSHHDSTSAVAAMVTVAIGFLAGSGQPALAIACAAISVAILAMRTELHGLIDRLDEEDIKALARYAIIAGAILPFLPSGQYGPLGAWNPQKLWLIVVLVTGFSFLGYVANRIFGERHGTIATALIGGAYSSTAVTQSLAQRLGTEEKAGAEPAGIALATAVMYLRLLLLIGVLATRVFVPFALMILPAIIVAWGAGFWLYRKAPRADAPSPPSNPIAILPALGFVVFVAVAAVAAKWAAGRFGEQGIAVLLLIVGSTDVDTAIITLGNLHPAAISPLLAAIAISGTIIVNMAVKIGITLAYARGKGLSAAIAMTASVLALAASIGAALLRL